MRIETTKNEYEIIREFFELHTVKAEISSVIMDEALVELGFAKEVPCIFEVEISKEEIDRIYGICIDYDMAAYDNPGKPLYDGELWEDVPYIRTKEEILNDRYGLIYTFFMEF